MISHIAFVFRYASFAVAAIVVNLLTQAASFAVYDGAHSLYISMAFGTATGLVVKYLLDKHYIFFDSSNSPALSTRQFTLYCVTGGFTTMLFWGTELAFDAVSHDPAMRYFGAALGLAIGYTLKYRLDRRFVFNRAAL